MKKIPYLTLQDVLNHLEVFLNTRNGMLELEGLDISSARTFYHHSPLGIIVMDGRSLIIALECILSRYHEHKL